MTPDNFLNEIVEPGLIFMAVSLGARPTATDEARVMLMAIAGQESGWSQRRQTPSMIARSFWQFESGGGVAGVMGNATTGPMLAALCTDLEIPRDRASIFEAMAWNDHLATAMARFLLWTDPKPLPAVGQQDAAWQTYLNLWRPGKPRPNDWPDVYQKSMVAIKGP
jgi:hypothetical protein